ncbi:MAG: response regulator, partial [Oscillospiraceae bacterium]|nr:response regulator [Oscillospiraceae bacterium]
MKQILLLEDDAALGRGISFALENGDIHVSLYPTLAQARTALSAAAFDLLILDVNLPDGNGLELLWEVRRSGTAVPVILLTANDLETDIVTGLESGADDYVKKQISLAVLLDRFTAQ